MVRIAGSWRGVAEAFRVIAGWRNDSGQLVHTYLL